MISSQAQVIRLRRFLFVSLIDLVDGPSWAWIMLNVLPIEQLLQYTALASRSFRIRLQMINDTIDFQLNQQQQQQPTLPSINE